MTMKQITIFCGSSSGINEIYKKEAFRLGRILAERKIGIIYGGANVGLMDAVANGSLSNGGEVIGVIPEFIQKRGIGHKNLTKLITVATMHERKTRMNELSDGVIALPGGFGTLEEFFEVLTWGQLKLHRKPAGVLNINGFYDHMAELANKMVGEGFLKKENRKMLLMSDDIEKLLDLMENYEAPTIEKWINKDNIT